MVIDSGRDGRAVERGPSFDIEVDGERLKAFEGETLAAVLLAAGRRLMRTTPRYGAPRGMYCGMGICYDCLMVVNGVPNVRACQTLAQRGMKVQTQTGIPERSAAP
jgi:predicted molibdopterin-dependent oxidoreductase YjgC